MARNHDSSQQPSPLGPDSTRTRLPSRPHSGHAPVPPRPSQRPRPKTVSSDSLPSSPSLSKIPGRYAASSTTAYQPGFDDEETETEQTTSAAIKSRRNWGRLARNWQFWSLSSLILVGGVGIVSAISLFRIPNLPNCRAIFWPTASATTRIQCAEAYADQGTVEGYLDAIQLVDQLPDDHPLRSDINLRIEEWAENIMTLAEDTFQSGQLAEAIAMVRRIPTDTAAAELVNQRVRTWKSRWEEAETIYATATEELKKLQFQEAFSQAIQLLDVGINYWETTKYEELTTLISDARRDLNQLGQAKQLAKRRTVDSMVEAVEIATAISTESPLYGEAQNLIREFGRTMLEMIDGALDRKDVDSANAIFSKIPKQAGLTQEMVDYRTIIQASELSWQGGVIGLEGAITRLQSIGRDRPLYNRAQTLIARWQQQVEGYSQLDWARRVAEPGTVADLLAAVAEAQQISRNNPVWPEAEAQIQRWKTRAETIQDQPFLDQADQYAQFGNLADAIATAQNIGPGRALYDDAQSRIRKWTAQIQRTEDAPILAQADQLAAVGRYQEAIDVASRIKSGRVLYDDAQGKIRRWRSQIQGQQTLQNAYQTAQQGTLGALTQAIDIARQVPEGSPQYAEAQAAVSRWSWDLFHLAETEAQYNLDRAIEVARQVPQRTEAYASAQLKIREWEALQQTMNETTQ